MILFSFEDVPNPLMHRAVFDPANKKFLSVTDGWLNLNQNKIRGQYFNLDPYGIGGLAYTAPFDIASPSNYGATFLAAGSRANGFSHGMGNLVFPSDGTGFNVYGAFVKLQGPDTPVANAGTYPPFEATSALGASVTLNGSGSYDPGGRTLTYNWSWPPTAIATGVSPTRYFPSW